MNSKIDKDKVLAKFYKYFDKIQMNNINLNVLINYLVD